MSGPRARLVLHALPVSLADRIIDAARGQSLYELDIDVVPIGRADETEDAESVTVFDVYGHASLDRGRSSALDTGRAVITVIPSRGEGDPWPLRDADACLMEETISSDALATALFQAASAVIRRGEAVGDDPSLAYRCVPRRTFGQVLHHAISVAGRSGAIGYVIAVVALPREPTERIDPGLAHGVLARVMATTRAADLIGVFGPCHFAVLVETGSTLDGARTLMDRLRRALLPSPGGLPALDLHFGLTTFGAAADTPGAVLDRADAALAQSLAQDRRVSRPGHGPERD